jgi:hypothetical protein
MAQADFNLLGKILYRVTISARFILEIITQLLDNNIEACHRVVHGT